MSTQEEVRQRVIERTFHPISFSLSFFHFHCPFLSSQFCISYKKNSFDRVSNASNPNKSLSDLPKRSIDKGIRTIYRLYTFLNKWHCPFIFSFVFLRFMILHSTIYNSYYLRFIYLKLSSENVSEISLIV